MYTQIERRDSYRNHHVELRPPKYGMGHLVSYNGNQYRIHNIRHDLSTGHVEYMLTDLDKTFSIKVNEDDIISLQADPKFKYKDIVEYEGELYIIYESYYDCMNNSYSYKLLDTSGLDNEFTLPEDVLTAATAPEHDLDKTYVYLNKNHRELVEGDLVTIIERRDDHDYFYIIYCERTQKRYLVNAFKLSPIDL